MLTIKLARRGKKNQAHFKLIILEKHKDPFGDYLEELGYWNPRLKKGEFKKERILYWLSKGAQMTASVNNLLINQGIIRGEKRKVTKIKKKKSSEQNLASGNEGQAVEDKK
jgi:small subunit ribosomal protein S16